MESVDDIRKIYTRWVLIHKFLYTHSEFDIHVTATHPEERAL